MITFYMKSSDGELAKCVFKNWDYVNMALFSLYQNDKFTFKPIKKSVFEKAAKNKYLLRKFVRAKEERITCGWYTTIKT